MCGRTLAGLTLGLATGGMAASGQDSPPDKPIGTLTVTLRPERDGGDEVTAISVTLELSDWPASDDRTFSLRAPIVYAGVTGIADRVRDLTVRDAVGQIALRSEDDPPAPGGFPFFRHWRADRPVRPPISISYRSLVRPTGERNSPPFGIRPAGQGVSGAGSGFLVLPEGEIVMDARIRWDLGDLPDGSIAVSTFGDGDFEWSGPVSGLIQSWYMAGPMGRFPARGDVGGFSATWLGTPPFDAEQEMAWAANLYADLGRTFRYLEPAPQYRVFMRFLDTPPFGGGTALGNSFMLSRGPADSEEDDSPPRRTFAHEMIHQWVGGIEAPQGVSSWFSEGLTTHYTRLLLMRDGHESITEYGDDINETFRAYFTSPARNLTADSVATIGFTSEEARRIPYRRGSFYFADLDARIRAASQGARDLDTVMFEVFERRARGQRLDHDAWVEAVEREIGPQARDQFEAVILRGETIVPLSGAFGPCFRRRPARLSAGDAETDGFEWVREPEIAEVVCRDW